MVFDDGRFQAGWRLGENQSNIIGSQIQEWMIRVRNVCAPCRTHPRKRQGQMTLPSHIFSISSSGIGCLVATRVGLPNRLVVRSIVNDEIAIILNRQVETAAWSYI